MSAALTHTDSAAALPSWRDTSTRAAILEFIASVTRGPHALPAEDRVAVFDTDGTLWTEKPMPVQLHFIVERWRLMVADKPGLVHEQPYKAAVSGDLRWLSHALDAHYAGDDTKLRVLISAVVASQAGHDVEAFAREVKDFFANALHPTLKRPYAGAIYQPMRELFDCLRANGFSVYITSCGDRDFMRVFAEEIYGIPSDHVIGSSLGLTYHENERGGAVTYGQQFSFFDDGTEKPVRIWSRIGRRPILAGGNSNGDISMLSYVQGHPNSLSLLVHHDDEGRGDTPYDTGVDRALAAATVRGWRVVSVRDDWSEVFPSDVSQGRVKILT